MKTQTLVRTLLATCFAVVCAGCAALATDGGVRREAYQRGIVQRVPARVDTQVVFEFDTLIDRRVTVRVDTLLTHDTLIHCPEGTMVPVRTYLRYRDTLLVRDTLRVTLRDTVEVRQYVDVPRLTPTSSGWVGVALGVLTILVALIAIMYAQATRRSR